MPAKKTGRDTAVGRTAVEHGAKNRDRPVTVPPPLLTQRHVGPRPFSGGGEGGAAGAAALSNRSLIPHPPMTDDMLIDQSLSDLLISLPTEDYPMDSQSNPMDTLASHPNASNDTDMTRNTTTKRGPKTKKRDGQSHGGHSTQHRKNVQKQGSGSLQK